MSIIGMGNVGESLGALFVRAGVTIESVHSRSERSARDGLAFIGQGRVARRLHEGCSRGFPAGHDQRRRTLRDRLPDPEHVPTPAGVSLSLQRRHLVRAAVVQRSEAKHIRRPSNSAMNLIGMLSVDELFEGRHFDREIIVLCVRWYLRTN
jgi:hypothetical protein